MSLAKVIEILAEGATIEEAIEAGVAQASETVREIKHVYVEGIQAIVDNAAVVKYRLNLKITFVVE